MGKVKLKKSINKQQVYFHLKSCKYFRFPFFDPSNCYRRDGLFGQLEDTLNHVGVKMTQEYGDNFVSINLRGSWLRGIPIAGDDLDVLFIVKDIPLDNRVKIRDFTRRCLKEENELFDMCRGKVVLGMKVEPIVMHMFPKQGDKAPWLNTQNYTEDKKLLATRAVDDGVLQFSNPVAESGEAEASHLESDAA